MLAKSSIMNETISQSDQTTQQQTAENHPVIRTLYDHADEITTLGNLVIFLNWDLNLKFKEY